MTEKQQLSVPVAFAVAKTVDSSGAAEVGRSVDESETVWLIAMLAVVLTTEIVLLSTTASSAIAERPRDAPGQLKRCERSHKCS